MRSVRGCMAPMSCRKLSCERILWEDSPSLETAMVPGVNPKPFSY